MRVVLKIEIPDDAKITVGGTVSIVPADPQDGRPVTGRLYAVDILDPGEECDDDPFELLDDDLDDDGP